MTERHGRNGLGMGLIRLLALVLLALRIKFRYQGP